MSNRGRGAVLSERLAKSVHRRDIDGLRGLAVAGVVAYHFGLGVPGGYGGVDVFFVISGFLIAGIIKSELDAGTFSIANFYVRRIRRILPALTVCLIATSIAAALFLFPYDFKKYGQSLKAAALSISNFYFMNLKGYFDGEAIQKPLLHTWSLGVEEQFYVVFPVLTLLLFRYARSRMVTALWFVVLASFAYSCYGVTTNAAEGFFSTAGRAWELGLGALVAWGAFPKLQTEKIASACAALGALLILACFLAYTDRTRFPGVAALPLCVGAALIIHSGSSSTSTVGSVLSSRAMVGLGLISYSVYLWHWPLLVFALYRFPSIFSGEGSLPALWLLGSASVVVGALSWALVEQPFRRMRKVSQASVFLSGAVAVATTLAIAGVVLKQPGWLQTWPTSIEAMQFSKTISGNQRQLAPAAGWPKNTYVVGDQHTASATVVWGDSYGEALIPGFIAHHRGTGDGAIIAALAGCQPLTGVSFSGKRRGKACELHNAEVLDAILKSRPRRVILIGLWSGFVRALVGDKSGQVRYDEDGQGDGDALENALKSMIETLTRAGSDVILIGPIPIQPFDVTPAIARHVVWNEPLPAALSRTNFFEEKARTFSILSRLDELPNVDVVYPHTSLCNASACDYIENGVPLYSDDNHLTPAGVARLDGMFGQMFADAAKH